jgi:hypothetical protein
MGKTLIKSVKQELSYKTYALEQGDVEQLHADGRLRRRTLGWRTTSNCNVEAENSATKCHAPGTNASQSLTIVFEHFGKGHRRRTQHISFPAKESFGC